MGEEFEIRPFEPSDLERVLAIERKSFRSPWEGVLLRAVADRYPDGFKVATFGSEVVGYVIGRVETENSRKVGHLMNLAVDVKYRRIGVGSSLLERVEDHFRRRGAESVWLEVREGNESAMEFYRVNGYERGGYEEGYYSDGDDAVKMYKGI